MENISFKDILYVSDGKTRRADIVVENGYIARITDKEEVTSSGLTASSPEERVTK